MTTLKQKAEPVARESANIVADQIEQLKQAFPEAVAEGKVDFDKLRFKDTGHIFIGGENLEVLKLLYKSYFGRVKMIYIDPPYNDLP